MDYWLPIIAEIATNEEVNQMTAQQLGLANAAAKLKIKLFGNGG